MGKSSVNYDFSNLSTRELRHIQENLFYVRSILKKRNISCMFDFVKCSSDIIDSCYDELRKRFTELPF